MENLKNWLEIYLKTKKPNGLHFFRADDSIHWRELIEEGECWILSFGKTLKHKNESR